MCFFPAISGLPGSRKKPNEDHVGAVKFSVWGNWWHTFTPRWVGHDGAIQAIRSNRFAKFLRVSIRRPRDRSQAMPGIFGHHWAELDPGALTRLSRILLP